MGKLQDFMTISMAKIQLGTLPHATLGIFLAAGGLHELANWSILVYIALYFVLITFACNINCLYDYEVDRKYKTYHSDAIDRLGFGTVRRIILLEVVLALILIAYLFANRHYVTGTLALLGLFFSYAYSASPVRLKKRGVLSPLPVLIGLYTLPLLGGWFLLDKPVLGYFILFVVGYALMNEGFTLVNTCEDYAEDKSEGIKTWAHVFGMRRTLALALIFSLGGFLSLGILAFAWLPSFSFASPKEIVTLFLIAVLTVALVVSILQVNRARVGENLEVSAKLYAKKMPRWFMTTRYPMLFIALLIIV
ncbi:MAG: prenyltransferase [Thermoplasmata archaeon]